MSSRCDTAPPYRPGQGPDGPCPVDGRPRSASCHTAHMTGSPGSTPRIPCVGALAYDAAGRLLLVQRGREPARGSWSIPGGKVEPGESPHAAVVREVWEETGLDVEPLALVGTVERAAPGGGIYLIEDFRCRLLGGTLRAGDDADEAAWFDAAALEAARPRLTPGLFEALRDWAALPSGAAPPDGVRLSPTTTRETDMADEPSTPSGSQGYDPLQMFMSQLRGVTDQLAGLGKMADSLPIPAALRSLPGVTMPPMPGALTAAQLGAISTAVSAQRTSVQAMRGQLGALDEQLGVLESILEPLVQWSSTWANVEKKLVPKSGGASTDQGA